MAQRGLVVSSDAAVQRAEAPVNKAQRREAEAIEKHLFPVQAKRFETPEAAQAASGTISDNANPAASPTINLTERSVCTMSSSSCYPADLDGKTVMRPAARRSARQARGPACSGSATLFSQ